MAKPKKDEPKALDPNNLTTYRESLVEQQNNLVQNINRLKATGEQMVAKLNHVIGAIAAVDEIMKAGSDEKGQAA